MSRVDESARGVAPRRNAALGTPWLSRYKTATGTDGTMRRRGKARAWAGGVGVMALAVLSACSTFDSLGGSSPSASALPPGSSSSSSFRDRFSNFVTGSSSTTTAQGDDNASPQSDLDCPSVSIRQGASTYSQAGGDNGSAALSMRYQANFVRFARECALRGKDVTMKVGIEGRVILGPAGTPGEVRIPVRLAVVKEGLNPETIWTKFYMVPVTLQPGEPFVMFTHVEEDMTFPMPSGNQFDQYVIYVGFDPQSAVPEPRKKQVKPARKPKPRPRPQAAPPPPQ
jgi:hypothetical protein